MLFFEIGFQEISKPWDFPSLHKLGGIFGLLQKPTCLKWFGKTQSKIFGTVACYWLHLTELSMTKPLLVPKVPGCARFTQIAWSILSCGLGILGTFNETAEEKSKLATKLLVKALIGQESACECRVWWGRSMLHLFRCRGWGPDEIIYRYIYI